MISASGQSRRSREWCTFYARKHREGREKDRTRRILLFLPSFLPSFPIVVDPPLRRMLTKQTSKHSWNMRVRHAEDRFVGTLEDEESSRDAAREARFALLKARNRLCIKRGARNRRDSVTMDQPLLTPLGTPLRASSFDPVKSLLSGREGDV